MKTSKKVSKTLILSAAAALAFGGVAIGTTYALFTSESNNQVEIVSGKVSVTSTIAVKEVYSPTLISKADNSIIDSTNNASADIKAEVSTDGNSVSITKMLPGDKVVVTVTPKNGSNVDIKYRETYSFSGETAEETDPVNQLQITGDEAMVKNWTKLAANGEIAAYDITIELPASATEEIEEATIKLGVEAVQGNAAVYDAEVSTEAGLAEALKTNEPNVSVKLTQDIELTKTLEPETKNITIYGDGDTVLSTELPRAFNLFGDDHESLNGGSLNLVGVKVTSSGEDNGGNPVRYSRTINIYGTTDFTLTLDNCEITNTDHYAINLANNENATIVARNSTITGYSALQTFSPKTTALFENCTLVGNNQWSGSSDGYNAIVVTSEATDAKLTFNSCKISAKRLSTTPEGFEGFLGVSATGANVEFNGCTFTDNDIEVENENLSKYVDKVSDTKISVNGVDWGDIA